MLKPEFSGQFRIVLQLLKMGTHSDLFSGFWLLPEGSPVSHCRTGDPLLSHRNIFL